MLKKENMGQSLTPQLEQEEIKRMANIMAGGRDREVMETVSPKVNKIPSGLNDGATPQMRAALQEAQGDNSRAKYLDKWNQVADVRLSGKEKIDNRTEWERNVDRAKELKNPNWKNDFISSKNFDRDGYERNLPIFRNGKLYSKSGEIWTSKDWVNLHTRFGQPKHYVPEGYKTKGV